MAGLSDPSAFLTRCTTPTPHVETIYQPMILSFSVGLTAQLQHGLEFRQDEIIFDGKYGRYSNVDP